MAIGARTQVCEVLYCVLTPADSLCCVSFIYPLLCWFWCPEIGTSSTDWAQLSWLLLGDRDKAQPTKQHFKKIMTMANIQTVNNCNKNICLCDSKSSIFTCMHHKQEATIQNFNNIQHQNNRINYNTYVGLPLSPIYYYEINRNVCLLDIRSNSPGKCLSLYS
jgi:hypothetical protein